MENIGNGYLGGGTPSSTNKLYWNGKIPWLQSSSLMEDDIYYSDINRYISIKGINESAAKLNPPNSIAIVTRVGVGKVIYMQEEYATSQDFLSLNNIKSDGIFSSYNIMNLMKKESNYLQGTSIKGIPNSSVLNLRIYQPENYQEQTKIGNLLRRLDFIITKNQDKLRKLNKLKSSYLNELFSSENGKPRLRFNGYYNEWEQRKLKEVARYRNGRAHEGYETSTGLYIVVNSRFISTDGKVKRLTNKLIEPMYKGEIGFVLSDVPNGRALAKTYLIDKNHKYTLNQRVAGITPLSDVSSEFLYFLMNRNRYFLHFDNGVGQTNLNISEVKNFSDYYPSYSEQCHIGKILFTLEKVITKNQCKLRKFKKIKEMLLNNLFI